jgi:hypothetical protein
LLFRERHSPLAVWYVAWKLLLSKIPLFREILGLQPNKPPPKKFSRLESLEKRAAAAAAAKAQLRAPVSPLAAHLD